MTRPLPRYGRSPRLQQEQSARDATRRQRTAAWNCRMASICCGTAPTPWPDV